MDKIEAIAVLLGLFTLRCLVPLALTLGIGYLMNWQVARWEAQDAARQVGQATLAVGTQPPCWEIRQCAPERRARCPAFQQQDVACWEARLAAEGVMPAGCPTCPVFVMAHA